MNYFKSVSGCALAVALSWPAPAALAQDDDGALVLSDDVLIVTATRRESNLQETAVSASVLNGDLLEEKGVRELYELQYAAPSVNISGFGSANIFNIRGIGRSQVDVDVPSGVVIYRDGAPTVAGYFQREPYFDIGSVEVYRGPQGTFVGKSAAGGAVFINTRNPELGEFSGFAELGAGNYHFYEGTVVVNVPIGDDFAIRAGFRHEQRDDFYDDVVGNFTGNPGEVNNNSYRASALWEPTDNFSALVKVDYHDLDFGGNVTTQVGEPLFGVVFQQLFGEEFEYTDESLRVTGRLDYEFGNGISISSLTAYQDVETHNNLDAFSLGFVSTGFVDIISEEINIKSAEDQPFRWVTGFFFESQDIFVPPAAEDGFNFLIGGEFPFISSFWDKTESTWAVFAHLSYDLTDQLTVEIGGRYSDYHLEQMTEWLIGTTTTPLEAGQPGVAPFGGASAGGDMQELNEGSVDGQFSLNYAVNEDHFVYGLVSRGHITGGINLFPAFFEYDEMQVINVEGGWKATWLDGGFNTQFSAFYQFIKDYQANFAETAGLINNPVNRNASDNSKVWGIELSGQYSVDRLSIDFGAAYLDSELGVFSGVTNPLSGMTVDLTGGKSPFSPEFIGNIGFAYEIPIGSNYHFTPRVDVAHTSKTQAALWTDPEFTLEARTLTNVRAVFGPNSDQWSFTFWVTNATDETYVAGIQNNATLYYAGAPRQMGGRLRVNF